MFYLDTFLAGNFSDLLINNLIKNYNKYSVPVVNESESLSVHFQLAIQQIINIVDKNFDYCIYIYINKL